MLIKGFAHGKGGGYGPVEYAISVNPFGRGVRATPPRVLQGDPAMMRQQIDAVPFQWKYLSCVISFAPEDDPNMAELYEVMEAFEELAFAGLTPSSRSILWVLHEENGRKELHFILPRQEVHTGKSFNPFPPGWQKKFDHLRDMFNYKYGWARPDDPARARAWQPGVQRLIQEDAKRKGKPVPKCIGSMITDHVANLALSGKVQCRADVLREVTALGYTLTRVGREYMTAFDPQTGKRERLKGTLFHEEFNGPAWIQHELSAAAHRENPVKTPDPKKAAEAQEKLQEAIRRTAEYHLKRYNLKETDDERTHEDSERTHARDVVRAQGQDIPDRFCIGQHDQSDKCIGRADESGLLGSRPNTTITRQGGYEDRGDYEGRAGALRAFHGVGDRPQAGYGVEAFHRGGITEDGSRADPNSAISGGQAGRTPQRQPTGAERDAQFTAEHFERLAGADYDLGEWRGIQAALGAQATRIGQKLTLAHDLLVLRSVSCAVAPLAAPSMDGLRQAAAGVLTKLPAVADMLICQKIVASEGVLSPPALTLLENAAARVAGKLPLVHELKMLEQTVSSLPALYVPPLVALSNLAEQVPIKVVAVHEGRVLSTLHGAIRQHKATMYFRKMARWAGGDVSRWEKVRHKCRRYPALWSLYQQEITSAHATFVKLCQQAEADRDKWNTVREQCLGNPFLRRELALCVRKQKYQYGKNQNVVFALSVKQEGMPILDEMLPSETETRQTFTPFDL